jgi:two-component system sensor histidine kinase MprB
MSLRVRLALATALVVAFSVALASVAIFFSMRADLLQNVDNELKDAAAAIQGRSFVTAPPAGKPLNVFPAQHFGEHDYFQVVSAKGTRLRPTNEGAMPVDSRTLAVAAGTREAFFADMTIAGVHARVLTVPVASRFAMQIATPLNSVDHELQRLELILLLVSLAGVVLAAGAGAIVSHTTLVSVRRVSDAAERVTSTLDTSERVPEKGKDELARLAVSFNAMLAALQEAIDQQKRFVADASHELLTPVTSLQTNLEVLAKAPRLPAGKRKDLITDVLGELREVRKLIGSLVELARGKNGEQRGPVRFDAVVSDCIDQATLRYPTLHFLAELEPTTVEGDAARLERAVWNLLENAAKWSEPGGLVEIGLAGGEFTVRDRGPGVSDADKPHVFERFYRAPAARGLPGSGLGLAIVREIAEDHDGTVEVDDAEGGGALLRLRLPGAAPAATR